MRLSLLSLFLLFAASSAARADDFPLHQHDLQSSIAQRQSLRQRVRRPRRAGCQATTAQTLTWSWYLLSQHRTVEEKFDGYQSGSMSLPEKRRPRIRCRACHTQRL